MFRFFTFISFALFVFAESKAQESNQSEQSFIPFIVGFSTIPSNDWGVNSVIGQKQWLKYDFETTSLTTYEGTISGKIVPFRLGINAQFENNLVGKLHRFSGFIGSKRTALRIQSGTMRGIANWSGSDVPIYSNKFTFNNKYVDIDFLYYPKKTGTFAYFGLGYTSMKLPIQLNTLVTSGGKVDQKYGIAVYDTCYSTKTYSFLFGFDNLTTQLIKSSKKSRLGMFVKTQDKFGVGSALISKNAEKVAELMNPGNKSVGRNHISGLVEYNLALGVKWTNSFNRVNLVLASGYEVAGALLAVFGGAATKPGELGYDPSFNYWRYGFVFKAILVVTQ